MNPKQDKNKNQSELSPDTSSSPKHTPAPQPSWKHAEKAKQAKKADDEAEAAAQTLTADAVCRRGNSLTSSPAQLMNTLDHMLERPSSFRSPKAFTANAEPSWQVAVGQAWQMGTPESELEGRLDVMIQKMNKPLSSSPSRVRPTERCVYREVCGYFS